MRIGRRTVATAIFGIALLPALTAAQEPQPALAPDVIAQGVTIADVPVGGLTTADARAAILARHVAPRRQPLLVTFRGRTLVVDPVKAGYSADIEYALQGALLYGRSRPVPPTGVVVPLRESVNRARLRAIIALRAAKYDLRARDAAVTLHGLRPVVRPPRLGVAIDVPRATQSIGTAILQRTSPRYAFPSKRVRPAVTSVPAVVVIDRGRFRLNYWKGRRHLVFKIAVGQPAFPTPTGNFRVIEKQMNPTWFPPSSPWAAGLGPIPPGVNNPLGTRWIGTSAPGIGIHGTPLTYSVGTRASHGCIRMYIPDVERLYPLVSVGTPVFIR